MAVDKNDIRVKRTERALFQALRDLALEKDLKDISVRELTERAGINRKTFYLHYHDIDGLIGELQQEFVRDITDHLRMENESKDVECAFFSTLCYLARDADWFYITCSRYDYGKVWGITSDPDALAFAAENFFGSEKYALELSTYLISALRNIFCQWYTSGRKLPVEEMARLGTRVVFHGIAR